MRSKLRAFYESWAFPVLLAAIAVGLTINLAVSARSSPPEGPTYEAHTVVDLVTEGQCRVLLHTPSNTPMLMGCVNYPATREFGREFVPYYGEELYFTGATGKGDNR